MRYAWLLLLAWGAAVAGPCETPATWEGRLGEQPLHLRLFDAQAGAYYLGTAADDVLLQPVSGAPGRWQERDAQGKALGQLQLECEGKRLRGSRVAADGSRTALAATVSQDSFNKARLQAAELVPVRSLRAGARTVEVVTMRGVPDLQTLRIVDPRGAEAQVNARLRELLLEQVDTTLECRSMGRALGNFDAHNPWGDQVEARLGTWQGRLFAMRTWMTGYCGGPHPYEAAGEAAFDTGSGRQLPLEDWLSDDHRKGLPSDTPVVERWILGGKKDVSELADAERDCAEQMLNESAAPVGVEAKGLAFAFPFPHAGMACYQELVLTWAQLRPFLSEEGRRRLALMRQRAP